MQGRGHRRATWALLLCLAALVAGRARAQVPGLPALGGDGGAPHLRLAGSNGIADSARALARQLEAHLEKRRPQIQGALAALHATLRAGAPALATDGGVAAPARGTDPALAQLQAALKEEQDLLQQGAAAARKAEAIAEARPQAPASVQDLDAVVALERSARAAEREAGTAAEAAGTGQLDLEVAGAGADASPKAHLTAESARLQVARAALARAHALEAQAQARRLRIRADAWWAALRVTPQALKDAEEAVRAAERRLARLPSRGEGDGGTEGTAADRLGDARIDAAKAEVTAARVHLAAARALATHRTPAAGELQVTPLAARLAALAQKRADLEGDLATLRAAGGRASTAQRRLREADDALKQAERSLGDARILAETVTERLGAPKPVPRWLAWFRAVLVAILGLLLIYYGQRFIHLLAVSEGALGKRLKLTSRSAAKLDIAVTLSWALVVVVGAAAVIVWWAFGLDVTVKQALEQLASPLFLVDDQPVSLVSIAKLVAALILAIVVSRALRRFLSTRLWPAFDWDSGLTNALNTVTHYLILAVGFFLGLRFVGIGLSSLALFASVLGIGIGFGLRNIAENFISGLIILAERPIKIGDYIDIDGTLEGQVRQIPRPVHHRGHPGQHLGHHPQQRLRRRSGDQLVPRRPPGAPADGGGRRLRVGHGPGAQGAPPGRRPPRQGPQEAGAGGAVQELRRLQPRLRAPGLDRRPAGPVPHRQRPPLRHRRRLPPAGHRDRLPPAGRAPQVPRSPGGAAPRGPAGGGRQGHG